MSSMAASNDLGYGPIAVLLGIVIFTGTVILLLTHFLPKQHREGRLKDATYESGMEVIGDARRRFNVRFYLVAMLFLLFDVELVFMYPWALLYSNRGAAHSPDMTFLTMTMVIFFAILLVGYIYAWGKGVFRYD
jgi:NADH-quinone oxidoreductase subunit A